MDIAQLEVIAGMPSPEEARQELARIKAEQATQAAINRAKEAEEKYTPQFKTALEEVQAARAELDNELKQIRAMLESYIQKRKGAILLANEVIQLSKWVAGARVRMSHPDGAEDWRIEGLGEQLIMDLNNGRKYPMFLTQSLDDTLLNNLVAVIASETGELIVKPTIQPAMPVIEIFQPGR